jgi:predicted dehydrogenase
VTTFVLVGAGFRALAHLRLAARLDGLSCVGVVARTPRELPVPVFGSLGAGLAAVRPDFVVTSLPVPVNPAAVTEALAHGIPVLSETPPGALADDPRVQVAEQYPLMPAHAARLAAVRSGLIGEVTQVQVSSTQYHHAVALIRAYLGAGRGPVTVRATRHVAPLLDPLDRAGWTGETEPKPATTTIATLDFGGGRSGLYDFTGNQTRNLLRFRRVVVRGSHGELRDDEIVRLAGPRTIVRTPLVRERDGRISLGDRVLHHHPYPQMRLNDDETALATMLEATAAWVRGDGPPPYPLAEGMQDHLIGTAIEEAAATGRTVSTR